MIPLGLIPKVHSDNLRDTVAVLHGTDAMNWISLETAANRFANALKSQGVLQDDIVTWAMPNGNDLIAAVFGTWKVGATPNMVPSKTPANEMRALLDVVRPKIAVCADTSVATEIGGVGPDFANGFSDQPIEVKIAKH